MAVVWKVHLEGSKYSEHASWNNRHYSEEGNYKCIEIYISDSCEVKDNPRIECLIYCQLYAAVKDTFDRVVQWFSYPFFGFVINDREYFEQRLNKVVIVMKEVNNNREIEKYIKCEVAHCQEPCHNVWKTEENDRHTLRTYLLKNTQDLVSDVGQVKWVHLLDRFGKRHSDHEPRSNWMVEREECEHATHAIEPVSVWLYCLIP